jgi:hypothetical protein
MSYDRCTEKQKAIIDYMINPKTTLAKPIRHQIADHFKCKISTLRNHFLHIYMVYEIYEDEFCPQVRLMYLRAKELGLL